MVKNIAGCGCDGLSVPGGTSYFFFSCFCLQHCWVTKKSLIFSVAKKTCLDAVGMEVEKIAGCGRDGQSVPGVGELFF